MHVNFRWLQSYGGPTDGRLVWMFKHSIPEVIIFSRLHFDAVVPVHHHHHHQHTDSTWSRWRHRYTTTLFPPASRSNLVSILYYSPLP
ncbi:hypothetical protein LIA77_03792 [Sarocladium implicatum]|nr:hypothetical protein LIA77_03792 [Sarocladium implicatum]